MKPGYGQGQDKGPEFWTQSYSQGMSLRKGKNGGSCS